MTVDDSYKAGQVSETEAIKRANEKARKNRAELKYKGSKSRNLYTIPISIDRVPPSQDESFQRVGVGRYRKVI